jgi:A/G-specific adenine glycosylase
MTLMSGAFAALLTDWQRCHGRHGLPWQRTRDPYRVWLSEVMLQQTQVGTVLGYYERFLERFPDVAALAAASQDEVCALWSGLGYYSRARNLHRCAQIVVAEHGGRFPASSAELATLPGIGRSTAAAIAAFCFGERVAILDGNARRVLARVLGFDRDPLQPAAQRALWQQASELLPQQGIEAYTQGLMDLGATLCTARVPRCEACPVRRLCVAAASGRQQDFPVKRARAARGRREHVWLWLSWRERVWLVQRPDRGIWAGLRSLPEYESQPAFEAASAGWHGEAEVLPAFTHTLTHLDWTLHPVRWTVPGSTTASTLQEMVQPWPEGAWFSREDALAAALPAPLRRLLSP